MSHRAFILAWLLLAWVALPTRGAVTVSTTIDRNTILEGETVNLQVVVEGGTPQSFENFATVPGLTIQHNGNQRVMNSINGVTSYRFILNYLVSGSQPGRYQIPSVRVVVDGASHSTQPVNLTVTKNDQPVQNKDAFVRLLVPRTNIYVGEIIPIEVQLYVTSASKLQQPQLTSDGFIVHKQAQHTQSQTQFGQMIYNVVSFKMSVSAAKAGKLSLGPAEMSFDLTVRLARDPNDVFGLFNRAQRRPVTVASPAVEMNVQPLPPNPPAEFSGAIGSFNWTVEANPKILNAGDPITLRVVVTGSGNLDNLKLPEFNWSDFKFYQPNSSVESSDPLGLSGSKTFEQVVIPQHASLQEIPALSLAYFDPSQKAFVKLSQPAIPMSIKPSTAASAVPTVARTEGQTEPEPAQRTDIVHIKLEAGALASAAPPMVHRPWFLAFQGAPLIAYAALTWWRRRQDHLATHPRLRRKREVERTLRSGLAELRHLAAANQSAEFHALLFRLLQEQLGERLDLPSTAITEAVLDDRLPQRGASPALMERLHSLFQQCNQARYAPIHTDAELQALADELERALKELQHLPD